MNVTKHLETALMLLKVFQKIAEERTLLNSFYMARITIRSKLTKIIIHIYKL